jgi:PAS domain S-box-containing protein
MVSFVKKVNTICRQNKRLREASIKLDCLKSGDLQTLSRQLKQTESSRFVDFIQNHPLPMVLVDREYDILHANAAMEKIIGTRLPGASAATYWEDSDELDRAIFDLKEKGQLLGREATLKSLDGKLIKVKLYTSLHNDAEGNWLNTRCLFVPNDLPE